MQKKVLITGASGRIGGIVRSALGSKYQFSALNRSHVEGIPCLQADITGLEAILPAFEGIDTVLHLAKHTTGSIHEWEAVLSVGIVGTYNIFEASRRCGVKRVVFASSGATILGYTLDFPYNALLAGEYNQLPPNWPLVNERWPVRPDSVYGAGKVFGEALGRYYSDYHGMSVVCLRFGAVLADDTPANSRAIAGYTSHADVAQIVDLSLSAPTTLRYDVFEVVSDNRYRWRDYSHAREVLGFQPQGRSDKFLL